VPMLRALRMVAEQAQAAGCLATVCGEIGGRPLEAMALIALGFHSLSMSPASLGPVKAMLLELEAGRVGDLIREELEREGGGDTLRPKLLRFAETHGIPV
jgi:phosphotransferase system, enzyme I, PtsP